MLKKEETGTTQDSPYVISSDRLHTLCNQHKGSGAYEPPAKSEESPVPPEPSSTDITSTIMPTEIIEPVSPKKTKQPKQTPNVPLKTKDVISKETTSPSKKTSKSEATQKIIASPKVTNKPTTKPTAKTTAKPTPKISPKATIKPTATPKRTKAPLSSDHSVG